MKSNLLNKLKILSLVSTAITYYISRHPIIISKLETLTQIQLKDSNKNYTEKGLIIHILLILLLQFTILFISGYYGK